MTLHASPANLPAMLDAQAQHAKMEHAASIRKARGWIAEEPEGPFKEELKDGLRRSEILYEQWEALEIEPEPVAQTFTPAPVQVRGWKYHLTDWGLFLTMPIWGPPFFILFLIGRIIDDIQGAAPQDAYPYHGSNHTGSPW